MGAVLNRRESNRYEPLPRPLGGGSQAVAPGPTIARSSSGALIGSRANRSLLAKGRTQSASPLARAITRASSVCTYERCTLRQSTLALAA
jgi:hypothetical protein